MLPKDMATPLRLKKIFVTGALLIEQYTASLMKTHGKSDKGGTSVRLPMFMYYMLCTYLRTYVYVHMCNTLYVYQIIVKLRFDTKKMPPSNIVYLFKHQAILQSI